MLGVQKICKRLNQIAGQFHILCDDFDLVVVVEPKYNRQFIIQTGQLQTNLFGFVQIFGLQIGGQQKILKLPIRT